MDDLVKCDFGTPGRSDFAKKFKVAIQKVVLSTGKKLCSEVDFLKMLENKVSSNEREISTLGKNNRYRTL